MSFKIDYKPLNFNESILLICFKFRYMLKECSSYKVNMHFMHRENSCKSQQTLLQLYIFYCFEFSLLIFVREDHKTITEIRINLNIYFKRKYISIFVSFLETLEALDDFIL